MRGTVSLPHAASRHRIALPWWHQDGKRKEPLAMMRYWNPIAKTRLVQGADADILLLPTFPFFLLIYAVERNSVVIAARENQTNVTLRALPGYLLVPLFQICG